VFAGLLVITIVIAFAAPYIIRVMFLDHSFGAALVVGLFIVDAIFAGLPGVNLGLNIYAPDVVFAFALVASLARIFSQPFQLDRSFGVLWLLFGLLILNSLVQGFGLFGTTAVVEARSNFYFWASVLYFMTSKVTPLFLTNLLKYFVVGAAVLSILVITRWTFDFLGFSTFSDIGAGAFRVINAEQSFFLEIVCVLTFFRYLESSKFKHLYFLVSLILLVVLLQHRTVWVSLAFSLGLAAILERKRVGRSIFLFGFAGLFLLLICVVWSMTFEANGLLGGIVNSFVSATDTTHGTQVDRVLGWKTLLTEWWQSGNMGRFLGLPYGSGYVRTVLDREQDFAPHNFYVQTILRVGILGLISWVVTYLILFFRLKTTPYVEKHPVITSNCLLTLLVGQLLYFIPYQGTYLHGLLFGVMLALAKNVPVQVEIQNR
jgi:hypothetical protein